MTPTSVGMRCPECAGQTTHTRRMPQSRRLGGSGFRWDSPSTWSITVILVAINCIVFVAEVATGLTLSGGNALQSIVFTKGVLYGPFLANGMHEYWRLLSAGFIHESIFHIAVNMLSLWFVGRSLEPAIGKLNFTAIYFTSLLIGSFGVMLTTPGEATLGASGAIFGVFGALIVVAQARGIPLWRSGLLPVLLFNLIFTLAVPGVSIGGHAGGLAGGLITGWVVVKYGQRRSRGVVLGVCGLLAVLAIVGAIAVAGSGGLLPGGSVI
jgi:membrane associated rhomboid family serine protease